VSSLSLLGLIVCDVPGGIVVLCNALIEISFEQNSEVIRRRTCITHTEKEQFGLKLTLKTQNLHRIFRERSSTSEGEHQFRPSHEQPTEIDCTLRKSLRRCGESQMNSGPTTSSSPGSPVLHWIYIRRFPIQLASVLLTDCSVLNTEIFAPPADCSAHDARRCPPS